MYNFIKKMKKFSNKHPHSVHIFQNWIGKRSIINIILLFLVSHLIIAILFSLFISICYNSTLSELNFEQNSFFYRLYFSLVSQVSPGFTEFIPANDLSRILSTLNSFIGISINAIYVTILVTKLLLPKDVFEICPFLIINKKQGYIEIRLYSKYPKEIFDIEFSFFRFFIYKSSNKSILGRTEEISIHPQKRKLLRSQYPYIIRVSLTNKLLEWENKYEKEGDIRQKVPINWVTYLNKEKGHFYLIIKAQTDTGPIYQVKDYYLNKQSIKKGKAKVVFDNINVSLKEWYDHKNGNWINWNKIE